MVAPTGIEPVCRALGKTTPTTRSRQKSCSPNGRRKSIKGSRRQRRCWRVSPHTAQTFPSTSRQGVSGVIGTSRRSHSSASKFPFQARRFLSPFQAASALMVSALSCRSRTQTPGLRHTRPVNLSPRIGASFCARVALRRKMPTRLWKLFAALTGILFTLTCGDKDTPWTMLRI